MSRTVCARCGGSFQSEDKYCRQCGSLREEIAYDPRRRLQGQIYGPRPIERRHICPNCGYEWTNVVMLDKDKFCPKCGSQVNVIANRI